MNNSSIELYDIGIKRNEPFEIVIDPVGEEIITNGRYTNCGPGEPLDGGLAVNPLLKVDGIKSGWLVIFQKFISHKLETIDVNGKPIDDISISEDDNVLDGLISNDLPYYRRFHILDNQIQPNPRYIDEFLFFDAPWLNISDLSKVDYSLKFLTLFTWSNELKAPFNFIFSFKWCLKMIAAREEDGWNSESKSSTSSEIETSIELGKPFDLDIINFKKINDYFK